MNITLLKNPKTKTFIDLKNFILSSNFPWYWSEKSTPDLKAFDGHYDMPFLFHEFLGRPESGFPELKFPRVSSEHVQLVSDFYIEVLKYNQVEINCFLRMSANFTFPVEKVVSTIPHKDHNFPHKNALVYLTNAGGKIVVGSDSYDPLEDDIVLFNGVEHYLQTPKQSKMPVRRIVLVATFI
jgi:hypothetical protein